MMFLLWIYEVYEMTRVIQDLVILVVELKLAYILCMHSAHILMIFKLCIFYLGATYYCLPRCLRLCFVMFL